MQPGPRHLPNELTVVHNAASHGLLQRPLEKDQCRLPFSRISSHVDIIQKGLIIRYRVTNMLL
jgi:hypothetical protein